LVTASSSHSVLDVAKFLVHLCSFCSIHACGDISVLKYSMIDQTVPVKTITPTGAEKISIRVVISWLFMWWKINSRMTKRQANSHANAVYLSAQNLARTALLVD
jgi:hypothetical protein